MGAKQSQQAEQQTAVPTTVTTSSSLLFRHAIILNGLEGSGKSAVQSTLKLPDTRILEVDTRFLTTPQIYSTNIISPRTGKYSINPPSYANSQTDKSAVWMYGGRRKPSAAWTSVAMKTKALIFTIDATRRDKFSAPPDHKYLPQEFVQSWNVKSEEDQRAILQTLKQQMFAKDMLENLLEQDNYEPKPCLILLTHADQPGAMTPQEVAEKMDLKDVLKYREWRIASCNALTGDGVYESIEWLDYIISNPTCFRAQIEADRQKLFQESAKNVKTEEMIEAQQEERDRRFARGEIFKAPMLFKTNGELWTLTEEQKLEFVVTPLSKDANELLVKKEPASVENPKQKAEKEYHETTKLDEREKQSISSHYLSTTSNPSSSSSSSTSSSSSSSPAASPSSETEYELSESTNADSTRHEHNQEVVNVKSENQTGSSSDKIISSFLTFLQSTTPPLPSRHVIPPVQMEHRDPIPQPKKKKKHFFSRTPKSTPAPVENQLAPIENIHVRKHYMVHGWSQGERQWHRLPLED